MTAGNRSIAMFLGRLQAGSASVAVLTAVAVVDFGVVVVVTGTVPRQFAVLVDQSDCSLFA